MTVKGPRSGRRSASELRKQQHLERVLELQASVSKQRQAILHLLRLHANSYAELHTLVKNSVDPAQQESVTSDLRMLTGVKRALSTRRASALSYSPSIRSYLEKVSQLESTASEGLEYLTKLRAEVETERSMLSSMIRELGKFKSLPKPQLPESGEAGKGPLKFPVVVENKEADE